MSYFIFWTDYDGPYIEEFEDVQSMNTRLNEIKLKEQSGADDYGTRVYAVIHGTMIEGKEPTVMTRAERRRG